MNPKMSTLWVITKADKIHGPFTTQQIQELHERTEIEPTDRLLPYTPPNPEHPPEEQKGTVVEEGPEITVMDLIKSLSNDPTYRLFEALQLARDKENKIRWILR